MVWPVFLPHDMCVEERHYGHCLMKAVGFDILEHLFRVGELAHVRKEEVSEWLRDASHGNVIFLALEGCGLEVFG